jgi:RND family efflux transporter MFP subunit
MRFIKSTILFSLGLALLVGCGKKEDKVAELAKLKKERSDLDVRIARLESEIPKSDSARATAVSVTKVEPQSFQSFINVQAAITGDQNVVATSQAPGIIRSISVRIGQQVTKGQTLATLDAAAIDQQIAGAQAQLSLLKTLYEKQQKLWAQNIGTEVQLMTAKTNYDASTKQFAALHAQRDMYRIVAPISGVVDEQKLKEGDAVSPGLNGIRIVNASQLKAEAHLGESYLGKVREGNPVTLILPDLNDSIKTNLTYVAQAVDPMSRAFTVQIRLGSSAKLHPNMSARMRIANYSASNALVVPISAVQKTSAGDAVFVAAGNKARSATVQLGQNANGYVEVLSGLKAGDQVITAGYEDLDNGSLIRVQ